MEEAQCQRVSELTMRTNQFNTTGIKRSPLEVRQLAESGDLECSVISAKDRFGDYGLVGAVFHTTKKDSLFVDTYLLSCRALGRGVEHQVVAWLGMQSRQRNLKTVTFVCIPSPRNLPAVEFLEGLSGAFCERVDNRSIFHLAAEVAAATTYAPGRLASNGDGAGAESANTNSLLKTHMGAAALTEFLASVPIDLRDAASIHRRFVQLRARNSPVSIVGSPRSPAETTIADVFCELLGLDAVDVHHGFFDLGGHSLLAMQALARLNGEFNVELTPMLFFTSKFSVAELADAVVQQQLERLDAAEAESIFQKLAELTNDQAEKLHDDAPTPKR
jgi:acyl carrier protein